MNALRVLRHLLLLTLGLSIVLTPSSGLALVAAPVRILRIVVVEAQNPASYIKEVNRGRPILKRLGIEGEIHVWQATYAGEDTGMVIVTFEFRDKASFARSESAFANAQGDPEYDTWVKDLTRTRKIKSDSLYEELDNPPDVKK